MIKVSEIPTYLKNSEVYKTLVEKKVKYIKGDIEIPKFALANLGMSFEQFEELLKTLYFWKVSTSDFPIECYLFIDAHYDEIMDYLPKFENNILKDFLDQYILNANIDHIYLVRVICCENNIVLLNYIIHNNILKIDKLFIKVCRYDNLEIIEYMIQHYDKNLLYLNNTLQYSIGYSSDKTVKFLLKYATKKIIHMEDDCLLSTACMRDKIDIVKLLIEKGATVNAKNNNALYYACERGYTQIVKLLLSHGANIHDRNGDIFVIAAKFGWDIVVKLLLNHSIEIGEKYSKQVLCRAKSQTEYKKIHKIINEFK